jgi:Tfp pilus assembly protein PilN
VINLLPDDNKVQIRSARINVVILRYIMLLFGGIALMSALVVATFLFMRVVQDNTLKRIADNNAKQSKFSDVKKTAEGFRSDLRIAKTVLDSDTHYSSLIYKISASIPSGVILNQLNIDAKSLGTSVTINAAATSFLTAVQLKNSFEKNTKLFSNVNIASITFDKDSESLGPYKYVTNINVIINKDAL